MQSKYFDVCTSQLRRGCQPQPKRLERQTYNREVVSSSHLVEPKTLNRAKTNLSWTINLESGRPESGQKRLSSVLKIKSSKNLKE